MSMRCGIAQFSHASNIPSVEKPKRLSTCSLVHGTVSIAAMRLENDGLSQTKRLFTRRGEEGFVEFHDGWVLTIGIDLKLCCSITASTVVG